MGVAAWVWNRRPSAGGRLGVAASGGGAATTVVVNIATSDAESFRRSEAQVSAALARAVARGVHAATALPFPGSKPAWQDRFKS